MQIFILAFATLQTAAVAAPPVTITVDAATPVRVHDRRRLIGTNAAMWTDARIFADPNVRRWVRDLRTPLIRVVMQSPDDWWMPLGTFTLSECAKDWKTFTFPVTEEKHLVAMGNSFNVWLVLESAAPVFGSLLIDRAGLLVR